MLHRCVLKLHTSLTKVQSVILTIEVHNGFSSGEVPRKIPCDVISQCIPFGSGDYSYCAFLQLYIEYGPHYINAQLSSESTRIQGDPMWCQFSMETTRFSKLLCILTALNYSII